MKAPDKCYFVCRYETDGEDVDVVHGYSSDVSESKFFTDVSKKICFSDCEPVDVIEIVWHNENLWYWGWMPGMVYRYGDIHNNIVWEGRFPEWDH